MANRLRRSGQLLVKSAAAAYDRVRPPGDGVVVLAYHRVGGGSTLELDMEPSRFDEQVAWLAANARPVSLDQGLEDLSGPGQATSVVVTFDDGTADFIDHALPILVEHGIPATYYIATRFIEEQISFPDDGLPMTWQGLADALTTGLVTIGSHTHSHAVMDKVDPGVADDELARSIGLIEDRLGFSPTHFAYPKGVEGGPEVTAIVARHFLSAATASCRTNPHGRTDALHLDRTPIQRGDGMHFFRNKAAGGLRLEGRLRTGINRHRYRQAVN